MTVLDGYRVHVKYNKDAKLVYDISLQSGSISDIPLPESYPIDTAYEWIFYEERKIFDTQFDPAVDLPPFSEETPQEETPVNEENTEDLPSAS